MAKPGVFRVVAGYIGDDERWHVAVSDGRMRAVGHGGHNFGECLRAAVAEFRRHPLPVEQPLDEIQPMGRWAYVDTDGVEGPDGEQWGRVHGWSDAEECEQQIAGPEGEVAVPIPALGARCARWRGKLWMHLPDPGDEFLRDVGEDFQTHDWSTDDDDDEEDVDLGGGDGDVVDD